MTQALDRPRARPQPGRRPRSLAGAAAWLCMLALSGCGHRGAAGTAVADAPSRTPATQMPQRTLRPPGSAPARMPEPQPGRSDEGRQADASDVSTRRSPRRAAPADAALQRSPVQGLPDLGYTSQISAILQLLVHDRQLGDEAAHNQPALGLAQFMAAYRNSDAQAIDSALKFVVEQLHRESGSVPGQQATRFFTLWEAPASDTPPGLGLPLVSAGSAQDIRHDLAQTEQRVFRIVRKPGSSPFAEDALSYARLPERERVSALVYAVHGVYSVYLRQGDHWIRVSDSTVRWRSDDELSVLASDTHAGLVMVIYQPASARSRPRSHAQDGGASADDSGSAATQTLLPGSTASGPREGLASPRGSSVAEPRHANEQARRAPPVHALPEPPGKSASWAHLTLAFQLIAHEPWLRERALSDLPFLGLRKFFAAYDHGSQQALDAGWKQVITEFERVAGDSGAESSPLLSLWKLPPSEHPPGLGLPCKMIFRQQALAERLLRHQPGVYWFDVHDTPGGVSSGAVSYLWLPDKARLSALLYLENLHTRNHYASALDYTVYLRSDATWYRVSASGVEEVSEDDLLDLPASLGRGFQMAIYRGS